MTGTRTAGSNYSRRGVDSQAGRAVAGQQSGGRPAERWQARQSGGRPAATKLRSLSLTSFLGAALGRGANILGGSFHFK